MNRLEKAVKNKKEVGKSTLSGCVKFAVTKLEAWDKSRVTIYDLAEQARLARERDERRLAVGQIATRLIKEAESAFTDPDNPDQQEYRTLKPVRSIPGLTGIAAAWMIGTEIDRQAKERATQREADGKPPEVSVRYNPEITALASVEASGQGWEPAHGYGNPPLPIYDSPIMALTRVEPLATQQPEAKPIPSTDVVVWQHHPRLMPRFGWGEAAA